MPIYFMFCSVLAHSLGSYCDTFTVGVMGGAVLLRLHLGQKSGMACCPSAANILSG